MCVMSLSVREIVLIPRPILIFLNIFRSLYSAKAMSNTFEELIGTFVFFLLNEQ